MPEDITPPNPNLLAEQQNEQQRIEAEAAAVMSSEGQDLTTPELPAGEADTGSVVHR